MAKLTTSDLANLSNEATAVNTINTNFGLVEAAMEKTLSRDGTSPNAMQDNLDMNQKDILNAKVVYANTVSATTYTGSTSSVVVNSSNLEFTSIAALRAYAATPLTYGTCRVISWYAGLNKGGGIFYYDSSDTTTADNGGTVIVDSLSRRWKRSLEENTATLLMFGAKADGTTDDSAAIASAIAVLSASNGGVLQFPLGTVAIGSTISVTSPNIFLLGEGADLRHVAGAQFTGTATQLKWIGAASGTMISFISPTGAGNNKMTGGGVKGMSLNANSLAGVGLDIQSWNRGRFENLQFHEFSTVALNLDVVAALSDNRSTQDNFFRQIQIFQSATTGIGLRLLATTAGANPSINTFNQIRIQHNNGNGIELNNCDNNSFYDINIALTAAGTGLGLVFNGSNVNAAYVARNNVFNGFTYPGQAAVSKGTASFTYPAYDNSILNIDSDNGTLLPTIEAGSYIGPVTFKSGEERETTIASAATTNLGASATNRIAISGTATITSLGTVVNRRKFCRATGAFTLTHNATSLILPGAANIVCASGDTFVAESNSSGDWRITQFMRAQVPPTSGTYTPTLTNVTNLTASTAFTTQWSRVGDMVTVSGKVEVDPTAAGATELGISLPVASNLTAAAHVGGTAAAAFVAGQSAAILADTVNDRASMQWVAVDLANRAMHFIFMYRVI